MVKQSECKIRGSVKIVKIKGVELQRWVEDQRQVGAGQAVLFHQTHWSHFDKD